MALLLQPSFAKGEVNPELFGRVDTAAYKIGLATAGVSCSAGSVSLTTLVVTNGIITHC